MHKLTLKPTEVEAPTIVGAGHSFGAAASELIRAMSETFGDESLSADFFAALANVENEVEVQHFDFSTPEDGFLLTYRIEEPVSYFTFGQAHRHVINGVVYDKDVIVKIVGDNARERMHTVFGRAWSTQYFPEDLPKLLPLFSRGILPLP